MYCENCGSKVKENDIYCENCGTKLKTVEIKQKKNTNWILIILIVFGSILFLSFLGAFAFYHIWSIYENEIKEAINDVKISIDEEILSDDDYLEHYPSIKEVYLNSKDIDSGFYSYYNASNISTSLMNKNNLISMAIVSLDKNKNYENPLTLDNTLYNVDINNFESFNSLDTVSDEYFKVDELFVKSFSRDVVNNEAMKLFNVTVEQEISYNNDICNGSIRLVNDSYKFYYKDCNNKNYYYTKIKGIKELDDYILVDEYVGYVMDNKVYDRYDGEFVSDLDHVGDYYELLSQYTKTFRKNSDGSYFLENVSKK